MSEDLNLLRENLDMVLISYGIDDFVNKDGEFNDVGNDLMNHIKDFLSQVKVEGN